jgi:hypothetical protein
MFGAIFRQAEQSIDSAVSLATRRVIIAVPFLIGAGFAIVALVTWLVQEFDPLTAYAVMAGLFVAVGTFLYVATPTSSKAKVKQPEQAENADQSTGPANSIDAELVLTAVTALGPTMAPMLARAGWRNLPLLLIVVAVVYLVSRFAQPSPSASQPALEPDLANGEPAY